MILWMFNKLLIPPIFISGNPFPSRRSRIWQLGTLCLCFCSLYSYGLGQVYMTTSFYSLFYNML